MDRQRRNATRSKMVMQDCLETISHLSDEKKCVDCGKCFWMVKASPIILSEGVTRKRNTIRMFLTETESTNSEMKIINPNSRTFDIPLVIWRQE
jgi:hypothetical protein